MRIMIISDSPLKQTGYGHQVRDLHKMFTSLGHDVLFVGMHSEIRGTAIQDYEGSKIYALEGPKDPSGSWRGPDKHWLQSATLIEEPDLVLIVWDMRKVLGIVRDFDRFFRCPIYLYWLFDAYPISHQYIKLLQTTRVRILPISQCLTEWLEDAKIGWDWKPIPEPVDRAKFYPLPDHVRQSLKKSFLGDYAEKFCFGYVGGNFQRKNLGYLIEAFANLPQDIAEDAVLLLHTDPTAFKVNSGCYDLKGLIDAYYPALKERIIFSKANNDIKFNMCEVYNVMDWQVSATTGEGWGLCTVEGLACGIPMIIGDISTSQEILGESGGIIVPISGSFHAPTPYLRVTIPDLRSFVDAMAAAYTFWSFKDVSAKFPKTDIRSGKEYAGKQKAYEEGAISRAEIFGMDKVTVMWRGFFEHLGTLPGWNPELINEPLLITTEEISHV